MTSLNQRQGVLLLVTLFILCHQLVFVQGQQNAQCHFPRLTPRHALNLTKLMGQWYLHEFAASDRGFDSAMPDFKCNQLDYVPEHDLSTRGKFVSVESNVNTTNGKVQSFRIPITVPKLGSPVSSIWDAQTLNGETKMLVLNVDREHIKWYILYSCSISGPEAYRWETVGIWGRSRFLDPVIRDVLKDYMIGLGFPLQSHKFHSQEGCQGQATENQHHFRRRFDPHFG